MKSVVVACLLATFSSASAASLCIEPPIEVAFRQSNVAVAATVVGVSLRPQDGAWLQTVLWQVDESWKGRHYRGSRFTTRTKLADPERVETRESFLPLLSGAEPYAWETCSPGRRRLQASLMDVPRLYQELLRMRQLQPEP